jgi:ABC-type lipoprotein release transport system permease subunit
LRPNLALAVVATVISTLRIAKIDAATTLREV